MLSEGRIGMSRAQLRFLMGAAVLVLLSVVGYQLWAYVQNQHRAESDVTLPLPPGVDQRMNDFHRMKVRDGKKVWEVSAQQARYSKENNEVMIDAPQFSLYLEDGDVLSLRCKKGRVFLDTNNLEVARVELEGDLEMHIGDYIVKTQEAVFDGTKETISAAGFVQIAGPGLLVEGQGYMVDVEGKRLTLNTNVQTTFKDEG
jgi:LPS export ABC transporter protein LptC